MLRFILADRGSRQFEAQRMCYRSSMEGWISLGAGSLGEMARAYVPHLGRETFFELFAGTISFKPMKAGSTA